MSLTTTFKITGSVAAAALMAGAMAQTDKATTTLRSAPTQFDFAGNKAANLMYMPSGVTLSSDKPSIVKKEPKYRATPLYGVVEIGNGPRAAHAMALDEPADGDARIYIDLNGDGDLTNDGNGAWPAKSVNDGIAEYRGTFVFRVSYGTPAKETSSGAYGLNFYRTPGRSSINYYRAGARVGTIALNGQQYKVTLLDESGLGVYNQSFVKDGKPTRPVTMFLDGDRFDIRGTFALNGMNYQAVTNADGSKLTLQPTVKAILPPRVVATAANEPKLLAPGTMAPDFGALAWNGGEFHLADLRGKIVVLDFWATWCGPCKASLPHVQKVHEKVKDQGVYVLALNVFDDKAAYDAWVPANKSYTFNFAYDPAGRDNSSIAKSKYNVTGIPTTYVIDKDGKIAATIVGYGGLDDHRLEEALAKLGVAIAIPATKEAKR